LGQRDVALERGLWSNVYREPAGAVHRLLIEIGAGWVDCRRVGVGRPTHLGDARNPWIRTGRLVEQYAIATLHSANIVACLVVAHAMPSGRE